MEKISLMTAPHVNQLVLRDGQQSTLLQELNFNPIDWAKILSKTSKAGFKAAEVAGGQSFRSAILQGINPFNVMEYLDLSTSDAEGKRIIDLQMLFRGANALGFRHYSPDLIELVLNEFTRLGINKVRFFDALNDIDNIYIPDALKKKQDMNLQGAMCFGYYKQQQNRYTDDYYLNYAQALVNKGCTSLAIKDMSGQLDAKRATELVTKLKQAFPDRRLELHIHSTDEPKSLAAVQAAIKAGVDGIETVDGPLSGGAAHHSLAAVDAKYKTQAYESLVTTTNRVFANVTRDDAKVSSEIKAKLCAAGVPGGAMPFVLDDLKKYLIGIAKNNRTIFSDQEIQSFATTEQEKIVIPDKLINLFVKELARVCRDAAFPLLVTPTADICTKQTILNLAYGSNIQSDKLNHRYKLTDRCCDKRFVELVLGHYGQMKTYPSADDKGYIKPDDKVRQYFIWNQIGVKEKIDHPYLTKLEDHISGNGELADAREKADNLIDQYAYKALSFASREQIAMMYPLAPPTFGGDSVERALKKYLSKTRNDFQLVRNQGIAFDGFEYLFEPLFKHIDVLTAIGRKPEKPLDMQIASFGKLGERLYEVYSALPQVKTIREFLENNKEGLQNKSVEFRSNYKELHYSFSKLFKLVQDFGAAKLRDLIIDLTKLDKISNLLKFNRERDFSKKSDFIKTHLTQGGKDGIADIGEQLARSYLPLLEKQW